MTVGPLLPSHIVYCNAHLLVDLSTVMEAMLTGAGYAPGNASGMPCTDASDLAQTTVGLAREAGDAPASDDTLCAAALGDGDGIDHVILLHD